MTIHAYNKAEALKTDLNKHTAGVTHTATFGTATYTYPIKSDNLVAKVASQVGFICFKCLKAIDLLNIFNISITNLQDIKGRITDLSKLIATEKAKIQNDDTESKNTFLSNIDIINHMIVDRGLLSLTSEFEDLDIEVKEIKDDQIAKKDAQIAQETKRNEELKTFTNEKIKLIDTICKSGNIEDVHTELKTVYDDIQNSAWSLSEKKDISNQVFITYAEHAEGLHDKEKASAADSLLSLMQDYASPGLIGLRGDAVPAWQAAMATPVINAANAYTEQVKVVLNKPIHDENDVKFLTEAKELLNKAMSSFQHPKDPNEPDVLRAINPFVQEKGNHLYPEISSTLSDIALTKLTMTTMPGIKDHEHLNDAYESFEYNIRYSSNKERITQEIKTACAEKFSALTDTLIENAKTTEELGKTKEKVLLAIDSSKLFTDAEKQTMKGDVEAKCNNKKFQ